MGKYSQNFFQADLTLVFADSLNFFLHKNKILLSVSILTTILPLKPGLDCYVGAKDDGRGSDNWSYMMCNAPVKLSLNKLMPYFLQAGCPTNSVKALKE